MGSGHSITGIPAEVRLVRWLTRRLKLKRVVALPKLDNEAALALVSPDRQFEDLLSTRHRLMRRKAICSAFALVFTALVSTRAAHAQGPAIPIEFAAANRYASANVVMTRDLADGSRFGFFHVSTAVLDYDGDDNLSLQNVLYFEPIDRYRLVGGLSYTSSAGISPTVGAQYVRGGGARFIQLTPRVNIQDDPSYSIFTIVRYGVGNPPGLGPYLSLQALSTFDGDGHIKSYQWLRLGLETSGNQFGVALNFDESGPEPDFEISVGLFVRREIP